LRTLDAVVALLDSLMALSLEEVAPHDPDVFGEPEHTPRVVG
jgi:hypothetical protein